MATGTATNLKTGQGEHVTYSGIPDTCPICHHAISAINTTIHGISDVASRPDTTLQVVYRCPRHSCGSYFIGIYKHLHTNNSFALKSVTPVVVRAPEVNEEVATVSPVFKEIYVQAAAAEAHDLDQIAGVGYRKALEFLIKDYCISQSPNDADAIKKELLGATIANRISDPNIKECARRAAWLGNDETHYERRWVDKDRADLKTLINLTLNWIVNNVLTQKYLASMSAGKP